MRYFALVKNNNVVDIVVMPDQDDEQLLDSLAGDWDQSFEYTQDDPIKLGDIFDPITEEFSSPIQETDEETGSLVTVGFFTRLINYLFRWSR
jgi:hypothetical protein